MVCSCGTSIVDCGLGREAGGSRLMDGWMDVAVEPRIWIRNWRGWSVGGLLTSGTMGTPMAPVAVISTNCLGANPGGSLGAAGLLVDPSLPDGQAAKLLHHCHGDGAATDG